MTVTLGPDAQSYFRGEVGGNPLIPAVNFPAEAVRAPGAAFYTLLSAPPAHGPRSRTGVGISQALLLTPHYSNAREPPSSVCPPRNGVMC